MRALALPRLARVRGHVAVQGIGLPRGLAIRGAANQEAADARIALVVQDVRPREVRLAHQAAAGGTQVPVLDPADLEGDRLAEDRRLRGSLPSMVVRVMPAVATPSTLVASGPSSSISCCTCAFVAWRKPASRKALVPQSSALMFAVRRRSSQSRPSG